MTTTVSKGAQAHKLMVFVLSMSLYGLATLVSELIPSVQVGIVEFSVEFFLFIPLTLAMLFDPLSVALGAATGELVFSEIMLGQFGGIGELEKFLTVTIAIYIAGTLVRDPRNLKAVAAAAIGATALQLAMSAGVDILKVVFAVEEFEAVPGLPESVFFTEGFAFLNDLLFGTTGPRGGRKDGLVQTMAKSAVRTVGTNVGKEILRGVLGGIFGSKKKR